MEANLSPPGWQAASFEPLWGARSEFPKHCTCCGFCFWCLWYHMPEAIEISWQVMTFDDSFDHKKTNLAFESTFYSFVELYPNGGKEDFS